MFENYTQNKFEKITHAGGWEINLATNKIVFSREACKMFGINYKNNKKSFNDFLKMIHLEDRDHFKLVYLKSLNDKTSLNEINHRIIGPDGQVRIINEKYDHILDKSGKILSSVGIAHDITDHINSENLLKESLEAKTRFIADASHELRTPLTVIKGNIYLAKQDFLIHNKTEDLSEFFNIIDKEVNKISSILTDLNFLTQIEGGKEKLISSLLSINNLIEDTTKELKILTQHKNINIIWDKIENDVCISGDKYKLEKLFSNIIRNAIKYNRNNGEIKIWIKPDLKKKEVKINISDNGIGIDKKDLPYIFDRFYRTESGKTSGEGGFGLGLAICKWVAEQHKGSISVKSELNKGSTFIITLPLNL